MIYLIYKKENNEKLVVIKILSPHFSGKMNIKKYIPLSN